MEKTTISIFVCMLVITTVSSTAVFAEQNTKDFVISPEITSSERCYMQPYNGFTNPSNTDFTNDHQMNSRLLFMDTLDQQQTYDSGYSWAVSENGYYAQSFIPTLSQLTRVELRLFKNGNPTGLTVSIRSSLNGPDLTSKYVAGNLISTTVDWHEFDFSDISTIPGQTYYIVWDPSGVPDFNNNFFWRVGDGNPYANGLAWKFLGMSWEIHNPTESPNPDFCFKTYGLTGSNRPPNKPSTPSGPTSGDIGDSLHYESYISDPDGDGMEVFFDWGDGTNTGWIGILTNGTVGNYKSWSADGTYNVRVKTRDTPHYAESPWSDPLSVVIGGGGNTKPDKPSTPSGPAKGKTGHSYSYSSSTTDPEGDAVYYLFDWDDGTDSGWDGPYTSGATITLSHVWSSDGTYAIKVKAKDEHGLESVWSDPLSITMPKSKSLLTFSFIENITIRFPFLSRILA